MLFFWRRTLRFILRLPGEPSRLADIGWHHFVGSYEWIITHQLQATLPIIIINKLITDCLDCPSIILHYVKFVTLFPIENCRNPRVLLVRLNRLDLLEGNFLKNVVIVCVFSMHSLLLIWVIIVSVALVIEVANLCNIFYSFVTGQLEEGVLDGIIVESVKPCSIPELMML